MEQPATVPSLARLEPEKTSSPAGLHVPPLPPPPTPKQQTFLASSKVALAAGISRAKRSRQEFRAKRSLVVCGLISLLGPSTDQHVRFIYFSGQNDLDIFCTSVC
jgi:hypothetical protein